MERGKQNMEIFNKKRSWVAGMCLLAALQCSGKSSADDPLKKGFANPAAAYRALPMEGRNFRGPPAERAEKLAKGRWGGLHSSVHGSPYLQNVDGWGKFRETMEALKERELISWIYDEQFYPSGRAGGLTLKDHPEFEAQGLFYTSLVVRVEAPGERQQTQWQLPAGTPFYVAAMPLDQDLRWVEAMPLDLTAQVANSTLTVTLPADPPNWRLVAFVQNRLYDGTHAPITGGKPFPNALDPAATRRFIDVTYEAYKRECGSHFGTTVKAFFGDEVSLMSGYLGDTKVSYPSPAVAWYHGLPALFKSRYGYDIREALPAIFEDDMSATVRKRSDFYSLISHQIADAYFKQISDWCAANGVISVAHLLWEESLIYHASFYGSVFPSFKAITWPGIDVLGCNYGRTSGAHTEGGAVTPKLASSVAHLFDRTRVMSESFCFVKRPTTIEEVIAHYAWQAVLGVNALTTISVQDTYDDAELGVLNDTVGRMNYLLTQGRFATDVAILYPSASLWAGFKPMARHIGFLADNPEAKLVDDAWREASFQTLAGPRDFDYLDEEVLCSAHIGEKIVFGQSAYSVIILPGVTALSLESLDRLCCFAESGGTVIAYRGGLQHRSDAGPLSVWQERAEALKKPRASSNSQMEPLCARRCHWPARRR
ncbi:MAG: hypothetical protein PHO37_07335 [Kiritimatiellae bacterium]|nr:hypothetical protein [Kiritimatiellia bacterium]